MPRFIVSVQWMMTAEVEIEADDLDAAMKKVRDGSFEREQPHGFGRGLPKGDYLDDSFEVNEDITRENEAAK